MPRATEQDTNEVSHREEANTPTEAQSAPENKKAGLQQRSRCVQVSKREREKVELRSKDSRGIPMPAG